MFGETIISLITFIIEREGERGERDREREREREREMMQMVDK